MPNKKPAASDPLFALIEAHKAAEVGYSKALDAQQKLIRRYQKNPADAGKWDHITNSDPTFYIGGDLAAITTDPRIREASPRDQIEKHVNHYFDKLERAVGSNTRARLSRLRQAAKRELIGMHKAFLAEHGKRRDAAGLNAADKRLDDAESAVSRAMKKLCDTAPKTPQGLIALIDYLAPMYETDALTSFYDDRAAGLFKMLARAVEHSARC